MKLTLTPAELGLIRHYARTTSHPRLLTDQAAREPLLARCDDATVGAAAQQLRARCAAYTRRGDEQFLDLDRFQRQLLQGPNSLTDLYWRLAELAFGGWLWREEQYLESARRLLLSCLRETVLREGQPVRLHRACHWGAHHLGFLGSDLAWTADFLHPCLAPAEWQEVQDYAADYVFGFMRDPDFIHRRLKSPGHNMPLTGSMGFGLVALLLAEELPDDLLGEAVAEARRSAYGYYREGVDDTGGCYEGPGYGAHSLHRLVCFAEALRRHGLPELTTYPPVHAHGRWLTTLLLPDGQNLRLGDYIPCYDASPYLLLLARWADDPVLRWAYQLGLKSCHNRAGGPSDLPEHLLWYDPAAPVRSPAEAGLSPHYHARGSDFITLRSGWATTDLVAVLTGCGRRAACTGHLGNDASALSLWAHGCELLHDPGYGFSTADAHSTVVVHGLPELYYADNAMFGARAIRFAEGRFAGLGSVDFTQMRDCRWAVRDVVLVHGDVPYLVVGDDLNYRSDWAEYDWFWQVPPGATTRLPTTDDAAAHILAGPATLDLHSFTPAPTAYPRPYTVAWNVEQAHPWSWRSHSLPAASSRELTRLRLHLAGYNGCLLTLLVPRTPTTPAPVVRQVECLVPGIAVQVVWPEAQDTIVFQPLSRFLQTAEVLGTGRLAIIREQRGAVTGYVLVDGYELSWRDQPLVPRRAQVGNLVSP